MARLYVGNLAYDLTDDDLFDTFRAFNPSWAKVNRDPNGHIEASASSKSRTEPPRSRSHSSTAPTCTAGASRSRSPTRSAGPTRRPRPRPDCARGVLPSTRQIPPGAQRDPPAAACGGAPRARTAVRPTGQS